MLKSVYLFTCCSVFHFKSVMSSWYILKLSCVFFPAMLKSYTEHELIYLFIYFNIHFINLYLFISLFIYLFIRVVLRNP